MNLNDEYKVSVCVVTYNQEQYIRQCLQSLVSQETNFDFEIIVADDCSTDGTRMIVQEFADKYPAVRTIFHPKNIGAYQNFLFAHAQATGKYIAHMDGDDYALPGKLQAQSDYLDSHPACNIVWHRMYIMNQAKGIMVEDAIDIDRFPSNTFTRADLLRFVTLGLNSSKMYRAEVRDFPVPDFPVIDFYANVEQIGAGEAAILSKTPLGVYRAGIGVASAGNGTRILTKKSLLYFSKKYPQYRSDIAVAVTVMFVAALKNRRWKNCLLFARLLATTVRLGTISDVWSVRAIIKMLMIPREVR